MGRPAARRDDPVKAKDKHIVVSPSRLAELRFRGRLRESLSPDVLVNGLPVATVESIALNIPPHVPPPGTSFAKPPTNRGRVVTGSPTVLVNGRFLARVDDQVETCNDPVDLKMGRIAAGSPDVEVG